MPWLWYAGPVAAVVLYLLVTQWPSRANERRKKQLDKWVAEYLGPLEWVSKAIEGKPGKSYRDGPKRKQVRVPKRGGKSRFVKRLPPRGRMDDMVEIAGGGERLADVVLVPKLAYLAMRRANRLAASDHQTVVAKLAKPAPGMLIRPLPVIDGRSTENKGVQFEKDPDFMDHFVVEGTEARAIGKWLRRSIREALMDMPDVWLRTEGRLMTITLYGEADADVLDKLVEAADAVFAERGAGGAPSLFGDDDAELARPKARPDDTASPEPAPWGLRAKAMGLDVGLYAVAAAFLIYVLQLGGVEPRDLVRPTEFGPGDGAWQGGWTTRGFGLVLAAEALLCGLFIYQSYLAAWYGRSLGKLVFGAQVVRASDRPVGFYTGVLLRSWLLAAVPLGVAGALSAQAFTFRTYLSNIARFEVLLAAVAVIVIDLAVLLVTKRRALHDMLAGTKVVLAEPLRLGRS